MSLSPIFEQRDDAWGLTPQEWLDSAIRDYTKLYRELEDDGLGTDALSPDLRLRLINTEIAIARALEDLA